MIKLLIFDFDGTLANSNKLYSDAFAHSFKKRGYEISRKRIEQSLGYRIEIVLPRLGIRTEREINSIRDDVNSYVLKRCKTIKPCSKLYSLRNLPKKVKTALVTNSLKEYTLPFLKTNRLYFNIIIGSMQAPSKQKAFRVLFKKFKIKPREAAYIGDRAQDAQIAREVGCVSIILSNKCSWSSLGEIKKENPDYLIESLESVGKLI